MPVEQKVPAADPDEDDDDDEEEEDLTPEQQAAIEMEEAAKRARAQGNRRTSISAAPVKVNTKFTMPKYEKTPEERTKLVELIKANKDCNVLFGHMSKEMFEQVIDAFKKMDVEKETDLIKQGDEGDFFYVVITGEFDIFVARGSPPVSTKVMTAKPGQIFGQLALMYNAPRAATVTCTAKATVWALERETFQKMVVNQSSQTMKGYESFVEKVDIFKHLNRYERSKVADLLLPSKIEEGQAIIKQGDEGDAVYFLESGSCKATIKGDKGEVEVKAYDTPGMHFGERALLQREPRAATVSAGADGCAVLRLGSADFESCMGPLREQLEAHVKEYPNYASFIAGK